MFVQNTTSLLRRSQLIEITLLMFQQTSKLWQQPCLKTDSAAALLVAIEKMLQHDFMVDFHHELQSVLARKQWYTQNIPQSQECAFPRGKQVYLIILGWRYAPFMNTRVASQPKLRQGYDGLVVGERWCVLLCDSSRLMMVFHCNPWIPMWSCGDW